MRPAPKGYKWCKTVDEAKEDIISSERLFKSALNHARYHLANDNLQFVEEYSKEAEKYKIDLIDIDHDAGLFVMGGGDYINVLKWLEETNRNYPIRIHSMNPVGVANMRAIVQKNGWTEVF